MKLEESQSKQRFVEAADALAVQVSQFACENGLSEPVKSPDWPAQGTELKLSRSGRSEWFRIEVLQPDEVGGSATFGPRWGLRVRDQLDGNQLLFALDKSGWILSCANRESYPGVLLTFLEERGGFEVRDLYASLEPRLKQVFIGPRLATEYYKLKGVAGA